uniref:Uncharacterized protein n=1 Tax=Acrobeloides nanus TaxID=290746 RepID=A0A914DIJ9_9BILA
MALLLNSSLAYLRSKSNLLQHIQARFRGNPEEHRLSSSSNEWLEHDKKNDSALSARFAKIFCGVLSDEDCEYVIKHKQSVIPHEIMDCLLGLEICYDLEQKDSVLNISKNFSSLVYTLGSENWHFMRGFYLKLAHHFSPSVRTIMASSLAEIAKIIGTELTEQDLLTLFESYLRDDADVRAGLVKNLSEFFKIVSEEVRERLIIQLSGFMEIEVHRNWRIRFELSRECIQLCRLLSPHQVNEYIAPLSMLLANDSIADVRLQGVELLAEIVAIFICSDAPISYVQSLLDDSRRSFMKSNSYRRRQSWGNFMQAILQKNLLHNEQFMLLFEDDLIEVSRDKISFVRLTTCQIARYIEHEVLVKYERVLERIVSLAFFDDDLEVQLQARIILDAVDPDSNEIDLTEWKRKVKERENTMWEEIKEFHRKRNV